MLRALSRLAMMRSVSVIFFVLIVRSMVEKGAGTPTTSFLIAIEGGTPAILRTFLLLGLSIVGDSRGKRAAEVAFEGGESAERRA